MDPRVSLKNSLRGKQELEAMFAIYSWKIIGHLQAGHLDS